MQLEVINLAESGSVRVVYIVMIPRLAMLDLGLYIQPDILV